MEKNKKLSIKQKNESISKKYFDEKYKEIPEHNFFKHTYRGGDSAKKSEESILPDENDTNRLKNRNKQNFSGEDNYNASLVFLTSIGETPKDVIIRELPKYKNLQSQESIKLSSDEILDAVDCFKNGGLSEYKNKITEILNREDKRIGAIFSDKADNKEVQIALKKNKLPVYNRLPFLDENYKQEENQNPKLSKENDELLTTTIDNYFMNPKIKYTHAEEEIERIYRELPTYNNLSSDFFQLTDDEFNEFTTKFYPIIKPFFEEKYIPTEREFKDEAKKLKVSGNFSSLGAAQNELAKRYGYKEYRAIKGKFSESSKSYDNINTILIHTYKLNEIDNNKINDFIFKFRHIFRKLNFATILLNQGNILENVEPILYEKKLETLHIQENNLMQIYSYFLTENSIIFGQIKRNIQKLSQDEKINILKELENIEKDKKDETVFGLFVNLLEYHIGKSLGDVTLIKNKDGSIGKMFKPKSEVDTKVENAVNEILNKNRTQLNSDNSSIKVSQKDLLDTLNISQSDEKKDRLSKQNEKKLKEFGFELNDAVYNQGTDDLE